MNWQSLISGELPDSDLWLISVFDRFSECAQEKRWHHAVGCRGRMFMPVFMLIMLSVLFAILRALHAPAVRFFMPPIAIPLSLPAAGIALTPRLLPVPIAIRRG